MFRPLSRRRLLAATAATAAVGPLAGCTELFDSDNPDCSFIDAAPTDTAAIAWDDLDPLEGTLTIYSGRTDDQVHPVLRCLEEHYDGLTINTDYDDNQTQVNVLEQEGTNSEADVFYSQNSSALAQVADLGITRSLPDGVAEIVPADIRDPASQWTATSGRVRAIQYNTDAVAGDELPDDIFAYAEQDRFANRIATRPNSGSFRAFIAAMVELEGEARTRDWISAMLDDQDVHLYSSGSQQAEAVANGDVDLALGNQYYAGRIVQNDPDAPIDVAFTAGDAGALYNVAGVAILDSVNDFELAVGFVEHLLAAEGQQFFVEVNGEYPVTDGVDYVGPLPPPEEVDAPSFDLNQLVDLSEVRELLNDEGMTV